MTRHLQYSTVLHTLQTQIIIYCTGTVCSARLVDAKSLDIGELITPVENRLEHLMSKGIGRNSWRGYLRNCSRRSLTG